MVFLDPAVTLRRYQDWLDPGSVSFGAAGRVGRKKPKSDLDPSVVEKEKPEGTGIDDKKGWFAETKTSSTLQTSPKIRDIPENIQVLTKM